MSLFGSVKDMAFGSSHHTIPSTLSFRQIDVAGTKDDLRLRQKGARNGSEQLPRSDSTELDSVEREIVALVEQERDKGYNRYASLRQTYDGRASALNLMSRAIEIEQLVSSAKSQIRAKVHVGEDWLHQEQESLRASRNEYLAFQIKNQLSRRSRHPRSHAWHRAILLFLLLIETCLNGFFMAVGEEFGLLGGIIQALIISLINIVFGFSVGYFLLRQMAHRSIWRKVAGFVSLIAYIGASIAFNLFVAHFRDALGGEDPELAPQAGLVTFLAAPFALHDFNSWMLLFLGCAFSMISLIDGFRWDDPYPGYGDVARQHYRAQNEYAQQKQELIEEVETIRDETIKKMTEGGRAVHAALGEHRQIVGLKTDLARSFEVHLDQLEAAGDALIQFYRQENTRARPKGSPPPAYFDRKWTMQRTDIVPTNDGTLHDPQEIAEKIDRIPALTREVAETADLEIARYKRIAEQYGIADGER
jgi:hypothetical protein